ncbi:hypothetical protein M8818_002207 [Zalaria obscura]|uniref:Uncharacterized protein n=1 Tax=Zalaria obscura TaxID=2024903 RepID=A0ACC3SMP0_9PEZI
MYGGYGSPSYGLASWPIGNFISNIPLRLPGYAKVGSQTAKLSDGGVSPVDLRTVFETFEGLHGQDKFIQIDIIAEVHVLVPSYRWVTGFNSKLEESGRSLESCINPCPWALTTCLRGEEGQSCLLPFAGGRRDGQESE